MLDKLKFWKKKKREEKVTEKEREEEKIKIDKESLKAGALLQSISYGLKNLSEQHEEIFKGQEKMIDGQIAIKNDLSSLKKRKKLLKERIRKVERKISEKVRGKIQDMLRKNKQLTYLDFQKSLKISRVTLWKILKSLEEEGKIHSMRDPKDRRKKLWKL